MENIIDIINAASTTILVIITAFYAFVTFKMWRRQEKAHESEYRPRLIFDLKFTDNILNWELSNIGKSAAINITLTLEPDILVSYSGKDNIKGKIKASDLPFFQNFQWIAPNASHKRFIDVGHSFLKNHENVEDIGVNLNYESEAGKSYKDSYRIEIQKLMNIPYICEKRFEHLIKPLEEIQKTLNHLTSGFKKLNVVTHCNGKNEEEEAT